MYDEYHCVVLAALKDITLLAGTEMELLDPNASITAPVAGYTLTAFTPLLTMMIRLPTVAVGRVTPDGELGAVEMML